MTTTTLKPGILAAYVIAVGIYAVALYIGGTVEGLLGARLMLILAAASVFLVTAATFHWGRLSGFRVISEEGISWEFLLRNVMMTVLVLVMLVILASPVWAFVFRLWAKG